MTDLGLMDIFSFCSHDTMQVANSQCAMLLNYKFNRTKKNVENPNEARENTPPNFYCHTLFYSNHLPFIRINFFVGFSDIKIYTRFRKIRHVITEQRLVIELLRIALRQKERLGCVAIVVDTCYVEQTVKRILAAACRYKPM